MNQRIELAVDKHFLDVLAWRDALDIQILRWCPIDFLVVLFEPVDTAVGQPVFMFQDAPNP